jgi:DNA-binding beta-propeller fold protein YncE/cytochrome c peroxidase
MAFSRRISRLWRAAILLAALPAAAPAASAGGKSGTFDHPTYSSPIAISADNTLVWAVNPADNSVTVIRTDTNLVFAKEFVGTEPQSIALDATNTFAYVADAAASTVTVIQIVNPNPDQWRAVTSATLTTGAEPWDIVASPDSRRIFVANSAQDTITVIDATNQTIIGNVDLRNSVCNGKDPTRHFQPRGLAVTQDSTKLYVTQFLSFTLSGGTQGVDSGKQGVVCRLDINTKSTDIKAYKPAATVAIATEDTGFQFPGLGQDAFAFPNQMQSIVIRGDQAYLPNVAASPSDPLRFNVDTEAFVNIIDGVNGKTQSDASLTKFFLGSTNIGPNLDLGAQTPEAGQPTLFFANPWAIAFTSQKGAASAYVVSAGSDLLVKVNVAANGTLSFTDSPTTTRYIDLDDPTNSATSGANAGKNPQGIVINDAGTTAYVANFVSRNVSIVDLGTDSVIAVDETSALPAPGSAAETTLVGAEMFFSSRGHFNQPPGTTISIDNRLSANGWQACASCHFKGLTDGVVWTFNTGPRKTIPLNGTFSGGGTSQRVLNYSAIFDEIQDFELNIRNVSGPGALATAQPCSATTPTVTTSTFDPNHGLLLGDTNPQLAPCTIVDFTLPNAGRNEITVTLPGSTTQVPALTALAQWVALAVRTPNAPLTDQQIKGGVSSKDIAEGAQLFQAAGCQNCHGGAQWTSSIRNFTPPPAITDIFCEEDTGAGTPPNCQTAPTTGNPVATQFLDAFLREIGSFNLNVNGSGNALPGAPLIGAVEFATRTVVNGALQTSPQNGLGIDYIGNGHDNGFSPPSLLSIQQLPPYYHNGACETLACVLTDATHRAAGTGVDILQSAKRQAQVVSFLESIDGTTTPF